MQHKVLMYLTFLYLCPIQHPHLTCLGIIHHHHHVGTNVWDFSLVVYCVVSPSWCICSRGMPIAPTGKWVAGTEGVQSQHCSGYTENEGPCDHCQQIASDKDLLRLMHVTLGGLQKLNLILLGVGPLIDRCRDLKQKNTQKWLMALNAIPDVSRLDKCVSDYKHFASALAHPNCPPRAGCVLLSLLQQGRSVAHGLEMLPRCYRAKYTQNERDLGLLTLRIGGRRLLHAANHAECAPSRDQVLPKHKHRPIAYRKMITAKDMLAILPSKLPFCAYSICVDEVAVEGDIVPSLVGGASPVL